ncbi:MAG: PepSY-like domain-containing protein [Proteobacteria bacterium]|nr:PepSY-like domain-containing protein [Pseudomonadota bacterium]
MIARLALSTLLFGACAHQAAPQSAATTCPAAVVAAVTKAFPGSTQRACKAEREDGRDQFSVELAQAAGTIGGEAGTIVEVDVTPAGVITQTEQIVDASAVPAPVMAAFTARYPDARPRKVEQITSPGKPVVFEIEASSGVEATFAADGTFVEEE